MLVRPSSLAKRERKRKIEMFELANKYERKHGSSLEEMKTA